MATNTDEDKIMIIQFDNPFSNMPVSSLSRYDIFFIILVRKIGGLSNAKIQEIDLCKP